jgi:hypothetical protein
MSLQAAINNDTCISSQDEFSMLTFLILLCSRSDLAVAASAHVDSNSNNHG